MEIEGKDKDTFLICSLIADMCQHFYLVMSLSEYFKNFKSLLVESTHFRI